MTTYRGMKATYVCAKGPELENVSNKYFDKMSVL